MTAQATAALDAVPSTTSSEPAPSKIATSGSYKGRIPSLFLLLFSRFALSAANLFPLPPAHSGYRDLSVKSEAITISLPPTSASISLAKHDESTVVIVQSTVVTVAAPAPTGDNKETSHGLKRIAAPFLVLIICCISATLYSEGFWREGMRREIQERMKVRRNVWMGGSMMGVCPRDGKRRKVIDAQCLF
jgi:hypothetical protein